MPKGESKKTSNWISQFVTLLKLPGLEILLELWLVGKKAWKRYINNCMYEVLAYEATLELLSRSGKKATFKKHKKIRYLQNNTIAYRDHAWGDGEILLNYRTNRGKAVDRYRTGYKTYVLLSLREVKNRGDFDEFNIQWDIHNGFLTDDGYWSTDVGHRTKRLKINVIFPKSRPPKRLTIEESNRKRTRILGRDAQLQLSDGRWRVSWETSKPKLYEIYVLRWIW